MKAFLGIFTAGILALFLAFGINLLISWGILSLASYFFPFEVTNPMIVGLSILFIVFNNGSKAK